MARQSRVPMSVRLRSQALHLVSALKAQTVLVRRPKCRISRMKLLPFLLCWSLLDIAGCVVTPRCHGHPKKTINKSLPDYILSLKANHPKLFPRRRHLVSDRSCCGYFTHPTEHTLKPDIIAPKFAPSGHPAQPFFLPASSRRMGGTSDNCCR